MKKLNKIIDDTLKSPQGKWSRKSITMVVSFIVAISIGTYIVIANYITETPVNEWAIEVFNAFMLLTATLSGITVWDKFKNGNKEDETI